MDIQSVGNIYQKLNKANLHLLKDVYHQDVVFEDAAHRLEGWPALSDYFTSLYANVISCDFVIHEHQQVRDTGFLTWTMELQHPKLQKGAPILVNGVSHLKFSEGQVIYHRDYFDLGEMLYENLPLLGSVVKTIKQRLGQ
ncbi:TPA: nuclear transport factor 2 family protein [Vibrio diabolicus]|uniref:nuclear transport factor 2 family protein n=1 Tax=Vibrio diabolicus TaxID=50719 RepID=UPI00211AA8B8|nr:nuclear transport factor 2 family protein [Vibrio diabolicus]MCG6241771.1 nuclear transport factor 2 family protein [Vibrio diabolicus]MCS0366695.1 nuclear transport factor 2 family protein [Vibrio diabolicus]MCZ0923298.1 nuclear transport factor 2 family protein [Vibrio diabolicus]MDV5082968.1 nuclear transport factor 2 family protein [Vibrio diabolicus]HDU8575530.1 nuclear transport factor 2 family protein [Vibrio diabolicus]